jgi:hypothetical protein
MIFGGWPGPSGNLVSDRFCYAFPEKLLNYCFSGSAASANRVREDQVCASIRIRIVQIRKTGSGYMQNALRRAAMHNLRN